MIGALSGSVDGVRQGIVHVYTEVPTPVNVAVNNVAPGVAADQASVTVLESETVTSTGTYSNPGADTVTLEASVGTVVDNGDGTWSWSFDTSDGPDESQTVTITATDSDGAVSTTMFDLVVTNVNPNVGVSAPPSPVNEGQTITATGTYSDLGNDSVTLEVNVGTLVDHGDGTWSWSLQAVDGPDDSQRVTVRATDSDGGSTATAFDITVNNVAPAADVTSDEVGVPGQNLSYALSASDPSPLDQSDAFTYAIDWDGDGVTDQTETGSGSLSVDHEYCAAGTYTVGVTATDKDTGTSAVFQHSVTISDTLLVDGNLIVGTGCGDDNVQATAGSVIITRNGVELGHFEDVTHLTVHGGGGNDIIAVDPAITIPTVLLGGPGDDTLQGGSGENYLVGEDGSDTLVGGTGTNVLDGGEGDDVLQDTGGTNTIIGGSGTNSFVPGGGTNSFQVDTSQNSGDADPPQLVVGSSPEGVENTAIALSIWASLTDADGSETLSVSVSGVPENGELTAGTQVAVDPATGASKWQLSEADLDDLAIVVRDDATFTLGVTATATEDENQTTNSLSAPVHVTVHNAAPVLEAIDASVDPKAVDTSISVSATFMDAGPADTHSAEWDWGDGTISDGVVTEADGSGTATGEHTYTEAGVYTVRLSVTDDDGDAHESVFAYIVVYDPSAGFVTGGGWIDSPEGAYTADPDLTGKANFGFVSKYKKGANTPDGQTQFQFKAGDLNFHSTSYEWLVIAGANAKYKGEGTINGEGNYGFMLTATDGQAKNGGGDDTFRIKIWDEDAGDAVVYDNQLGVADDQYDGTALGGGNIVIHDNQGKKLTAIESAGGTSGTPLTQPMLDEAIAASLADWATAGVSTSRLHAMAGVDFDLAALPGETLGLASSSTNKVWLDVDAAGLGWSIDAGSGGYDLLSAVSHEIGHKLGYDHDVLEESLAAGERQLASEHVRHVRLRTDLARAAARRDALFESLGGNEDELDDRARELERPISLSAAFVAARVHARSQTATDERIGVRDDHGEDTDHEATAHDEFFSSLGDELAEAGKTSTAV